ncbi:MAG: hypothetical protein QXL96_11870, partial [Ignisphaera sp.]
YEVSIPGLESGIYRVVIEASMPLMMWTLSNVYESQLSVGEVAISPTPTVTTPVTTPIPTETFATEFVVAPVIPGLRTITVSMPASVTVTTPAVEVARPTVEIKPVEVAGAMNLSAATIGLAIAIIAISAVLTFVKRPG